MNWISSIFRKKRANNTLFIGGEPVEIKPVGLQEAIELILIIAPYVPLLERAWPEFQAAMTLTNGKRPEVLSALFLSLAKEMQQAPGEMTRVVALLIDRPVEWVAVNATAEDVFKSLPVIDAVNRFDQILTVAKQTVRFDNGQ